MKKTWGEFCDIFGINPRNRILEFFLEGDEIDFSIGEVCEETELNRATTYNIIDGLIKEKLIILTRKVSGCQLYKLDKGKKEVKILLKVFDMILDKICDEYSKKEEVYA